MLLKTMKRFFSLPTVPLVDLMPYLNHSPNLSSTSQLSDLPKELQNDCKNVAEALHKFGSLAIKDPRADQTDNQRFLDLMEVYFEKRYQEYHQHRSLEKLPDCFPEMGFETGLTPEFFEKARDHSERMKQLEKPNDPKSPLNPIKDAKWRYLYIIGSQGVESEDLLPDTHVPSDFPEFNERFDKWGNTMLDAVKIVTEMASLGLELPRDYFIKFLEGGSHRLAPTGSNLSTQSVGTVFAGYHYDFNFLTIHGKSRYPGLSLWLRDGQKIPASIPDDTLLLQSGKQFEMLTGGYIQCGFHEVIYTEGTKQKYDEYLETKGTNQWRVSSTLFSHVKHDVSLYPREHFNTPEVSKLYSPITAFELLQEELKAIDLHPNNY